MTESNSVQTKSADQQGPPANQRFEDYVSLHVFNKALDSLIRGTSKEPVISLPTDFDKNKIITKLAKMGITLEHISGNKYSVQPNYFSADTPIETKASVEPKAPNSFLGNPFGIKLNRRCSEKAEAPNSFLGNPFEIKSDDVCSEKAEAPTKQTSSDFISAQEAARKVQNATQVEINKEINDTKCLIRIAISKGLFKVSFITEHDPAFIRKYFSPLGYKVISKLVTNFGVDFIQGYLITISW